MLIYNLVDLTKDNIIDHILEIATNISEEKRCELYVLDENNEPIYKYKLANENVNYYITRMSNFTQDTLDNKNLLDIYYDNDKLTAATIVPLYMYKKYVGSIVLTKDFTSYYNSISNFIGLVKIVNIAIFIFMIMAVYLLSGRIVKPLAVLREVFKDVKKGEYDREVNINSKDEIGDLAKGFSSMKTQIKNQIVTMLENNFVGYLLPDTLLVIDLSSNNVVDKVTIGIFRDFKPIDADRIIFTLDNDNDDNNVELTVAMYSINNKIKKLCSILC